MTNSDNERLKFPPPRKKWGQCFLVDKNCLSKLVRIIQPTSQDTIFEIGCGRGSLTTLLAPEVKNFIGIEIDPLLYKEMGKMPEIHRATIYNQDILDVDFDEIGLRKEVRAVGNIPYNLTSPIIFKLLEDDYRWKDIHLMVQKEVADRITAKPGSKLYGRLSIMVQVKMDVRRELVVSKEVFQPRPSVNSAFISMRRLSRYPMDDHMEKLFGNVILSAFQKRRKMLKNSLKKYDLEGVSPADLSRRPEELSVDEFYRLVSNLIKNKNSL